MTSTALLKSMRYRHQPIRRVYIPKANGKKRPIGISCLEDKIVQGALREVTGAESVALADMLPGMCCLNRRFTVEGEAYASERDVPYAPSASITPDFFSTFGVDVSAGRGFRRMDHTDVAPVAMVFGVLFVVFGIAALFMACVGLCGVLSFSVSRRTNEMGMRMALGAGAADIVKLIMRQGFAHLGMGLGIGLVLSIGLLVAVAPTLFEAAPLDWTVYVGTFAVILAVGILASVVPAIRATNVDLVEALRYERAIGAAISEGVFTRC